MTEGRQYNQMNLFTPDQLADMVQVLPDHWETFLQATKGATFDQTDKDRIIINRCKSGRKNKKLPRNGTKD